jgi:alpha-beta hydrolase superfamily lysophospholipase
MTSTLEIRGSQTDKPIQLISTPPTEEMIPGGAGNLLVRSWRPTSPPRRVIAICHGFNAHSGYYMWTAEQFVADGYAVYAVDLRGRGRSEGERFYVETIGEYVADVDSLVNFAKSREPDLPVFLLGHSAGGVTAVTYAIDHQSELAGLICEDFAYQVPAPDFALAVLKGLSHVAPHAQAVALNNEDFSRDPSHIRAMNDDPLIRNEKQPFQTMAALVRADERLKRDFARISLPVLILHGAADKAAKVGGSKAFYEQAGSADKTLQIFEGRYHDMLNDLGKEELLSAIKIWINQHLRRA